MQSGEMNATVARKARSDRRRNDGRRLVFVAMSLLLCVVLVGCGAVRGRRGAPERSGFLGDYSQLKEREGYKAQLVYVNPNARWTSYRAVHIDSVTLWANQATGKLGEQDRQMLTDILFKALYDELGKYFELTDQLGPGVLRLRAALTQAKGANVPLRTMTTYVPQLNVAGMAIGLGADTANTVGTATVEAEILDPITGERLAAAVDRRAGTKSPVTTRTFKKWGDVQAAANFWAEHVARFLLRAGVERKPGA